MIREKQVMKPKVRSYEHADAHAAHGDDAGDLKASAALSTHQTVPCLQAARGTLTPGAFSLCLLVFRRLSLPRVVALLIPIQVLILKCSHDAFFFLFNKRQVEYNSVRTDGSEPLLSESPLCRVESFLFCRADFC